MSSSTSNADKSSDCRGNDYTDTSDKIRIATNSNDDLRRLCRSVAPQSNSIERNNCSTEKLARLSPEDPGNGITSGQLAQILTKTSKMDTPPEVSVTTSITTIASPSTSMTKTAAEGSLLANRDRDLDSAEAADVPPNLSKGQLTDQGNLNLDSKRGNSIHQSVNNSLSDSLISTEENRTPKVENLSKTNLYIRGLSTSTTDEDLYNMCAKFGKILSTKAIFDRTTGCCRGYGFVEYIAPQSAELAVEGLMKSGVQAQMAKIPSPYPFHNYVHHHHYHQQHHNHMANHSQHHHYNQNNGVGNYKTSKMSANSQSLNNIQRKNNADPTNLYIANLPPNMSEYELELLLSSYGPVVSTRILRDESNNPRGVGFARMESRDKCQEIIEKLNGKSYKGSQDPLLVKFADGGNRKRHNQNYHHNSTLHHQKLNHDDHRWRESSNTSDLNCMAGFEQHNNIPLSNQISDLSMLGALGYPRMQTSYPPNMTLGTGYSTTLGPPTSGHQWLQPSAEQQWSVIPQQMMQSDGPNSSTQSTASVPFPYGHIPQLASHMQGLQISHHSGAPVRGYLQPHHQWPPIWPHPIPSQHHQASVRLANPVPPPNTTPRQQAPVLVPSDSVQTFMSGQELVQNLQPTQANVGDTGNQIQVSAPM